VAIRLIIAVVSIAYAASTGEAGNGSAPGRGDTLAALEKAQRESAEKLQTWRGRVDVVDRETVAGALRSEFKSRVDFVYDAKWPAAWWNWKVGGSDPIGTAPPGADLVGTSKMRKYLALYSLASPNSTSSAASMRRNTFTISDAPQLAVTLRSRDFDPAFFLTAGARRVDDPFRPLCTPDGRPLGPDAVVHRQGDLAKVDSPHERGRDVYEFDLSRGGRIVSMTRTREADREEWTFHLQEISGVWLPRQIVIQHTANSPAVIFRREVQFVEQEVNEPVPLEQFSLTAIGARRGDVVVDEAAKVKYVYQSGPEAPEASQQVPPHAPNVAWLIGNGLAWVLVILILLIANRSWRTRQAGDQNRSEAI
jgi:hypothetical protein